METQNNTEVREQPPLSNARLAVLVLLGAETMLFSGLIGGVSRVSGRKCYLGPRRHISGLNCPAS